MRAALLVLALSLPACGPKVSTTPLTFDEDLGRQPTEGSAVDPTLIARPIATPGKGARTGTIPRPRLVAVLDAGPGAFLRQLEVTAKMNGEKFIGWELVQLIDWQSPLVDVDVVPGDVLLAINGQALSRPDQLQTVWDSLRTANEVTAQLWRGNAQLTLAFVVEPTL